MNSNRGEKYWTNEMGEQTTTNQRKYNMHDQMQEDGEDVKNNRSDWKNNPERGQNHYHKSKRIMSGGSSMSPPPHHANRRINMNIQSSGN